MPEDVEPDENSDSSQGEDLPRDNGAEVVSEPGETFLDALIRGEDTGSEPGENQPVESDSDEESTIQIIENLGDDNEEIEEIDEVATLQAQIRRLERRLDLTSAGA